jgi:hypothetical protein
MGTADRGSWLDQSTPSEKFRDLTGAHPVIWVAAILTLLCVVSL